MQLQFAVSKVCKKCGVSQPPEAFYRCCGYADGRSRTCIKCERLYKRRPDVMARAREQATRSHGKKVARRQAVAATLTVEEWERAVAYFGGCAYCGSTTGTMHRDHFIPASCGGAFTADNIIPSCGRCNYRKHQRMPQDWCEPATYERILAYFASIDLTPNDGRPLRSPGYATGERHGSKTHPESIARGESHYNAKLTRVEVDAIRRRYAEGGITQERLALEYGVCESLISAVVRGIRWSMASELS